jgi:hypothetical protein
MPFLQASARTGNSKKLQELAPRIVEDAFIARQVCQQLKEITNLSPEMENLIDENYCASQ